MKDGIEILLVEDNPGDAFLIEEYLAESVVYQVKITKTTRLAEAIQILSGSSFDSIILDLNLPDSNGLETLKEITPYASQTAIIVMTGMDDIETGKKAVEISAQEYIVKSKSDSEILNQSVCYAIARKTDQNKLNHYFKVLTAIRSVNQLITQENDNRLLIEKACRQLVSANGYLTAWIILMNDKAKLIHQASFGFDDNIIYLFRDFMEGKYPACVKKAMLSDGIVYTKNWDENCRECPVTEVYKGYGTITQQLKYQDRMYGIISVSSSPSYLTNKDEIDLFTELTNDLAFAIYKNNIFKEEVRLREELKSSEKKFRFIADNSIDCLWQLDKRLKFTYLSPSLYDMTGFQPEEWIGTPLWQHTRKKEFFKMARLAVKMIRDYRKMKKVRFETWMLNKDNEEIPVEIIGKPLLDENGKLLGLQGTTRDIKERIEHQEKILRINEELHNQNEEYLMLNEELSESMTKIQATTLELEEAKEKSDNLLEKTLNQNKAIEQNNKLLECLLDIATFKSENIQDILQNSIKEAVGITRSLFGFIYYYYRDMEEFQLKSWYNAKGGESDLNLRWKLSLSESGVLGDVVHNHNPRRIFGLDNPLTIGTIVPQIKENIVSFLAVPLNVTEKVDLVVALGDKNEPYGENDEIHVKLLMDSMWKVLDRNRLIEDLKFAKNKAEESDRLKSAFLANMSHEVRTPLNAIMGFSQLINQGSIPAGKMSEYTEIINNSGNRLLRIVNDIVDISKLEASALKVNITRVDICAMMQKILLTHSESAILKKKPEVSLHLLKPLNVLHCVVLTDPARLQQILDNLITNSIKYTEKGKIEIGYELLGQKDQLYLEFFVKDSGCGIPENKQGVIFERFRQIEETGYREGAGLGLSISKGLVELLGGRIRLDSKVNHGTTLYFTHPYHPVTEHNEIRLQTSQVENLLEGKKIIIAEDDYNSFIYLYEILYPHKPEIIHAENGEALMLKLIELVPDLILLDINMPGKDGFQCMEEIRKRGIKTRIIAQTAYAMTVEREKCLELGCQGYIAKPIQSAELLQIIHEVLTESLNPGN